MGWWKIRDVETGQVDHNHKCPTNSNSEDEIRKWMITE